MFRQLTIGAIALALPTALQAQGRTPLPMPAAPAKPAAGAAVYDTAGAMVGTIESITADAAVISTGTVKVPYPIASIASSAKGLTIAMTKPQLEAAAQQQQAQAGAALQSRLVAGTAVSGLNGSPLGTIKAADAQYVTVTTSGGQDVKLPVNGFAAAPNGAGVRLGMTAAQFAAATGTPAPAAGTTTQSTTTTTTQPAAPATAGEPAADAMQPTTSTAAPTGGAMAPSSSMTAPSATATPSAATTVAPAPMTATGTTTTTTTTKSKTKRR